MLGIEFAQPEVPAPDAGALSFAAAANAPPEPARVRERVATARARQHARQGMTNARLAPAGVACQCAPGRDAEHLLAQAVARYSLSARACHRIAKVARTIADLAESELIEVAHIAEAIGYRRFDGAASGPRRAI